METMNNTEIDFDLWELECTVLPPVKDIVNDGELLTGAIDAGEHSEQRIAELVEIVKKHVVNVDPLAPSCCIDGRKCAYTMGNGETSLRPSLAGGPVTPYVAAELTNWHGLSNGSSTERFIQVADFLNDNGLPTGSHIDTSAEACNLETGKTGCGADDRVTENAGHIDNQQSAVRTLTASLLGTHYSEASMNFTSDADMRARLQDWDPVAVVRYLEDRNPATVEVMENDGSPTGGHHETFVVFNYIEDSTIDRDAFFEETGEQLFVVDMWYLDKVARAMAKDGSEEDYLALKHAMVSYQLGTYITLCNGTQRPVTITRAA